MITVAFNSSNVYLNAKVRNDLLDFAKTKITDDMTVAEAKAIKKARKAFDDSLKQTATRWLLDAHNINVATSTHNWGSFVFEHNNGIFDKGRIDIRMYGHSEAIRPQLEQKWSITAAKLIKLYGKI